MTTLLYLDMPIFTKDSQTVKERTSNVKKLENLRPVLLCVFFFSFCRCLIVSFYSYCFALNGLTVVVGFICLLSDTSKLNYPLWILFRVNCLLTPRPLSNDLLRLLPNISSRTKRLEKSQL